MSNVSQWSTTAASNNASPPNGWPENMARASVNDSAREMMAALAKWFLDTDGSLVSAGGTTAYTLATNSSNAALADISLLVFRINATNTGACTLAVDGLTAKSWTKPGGTALSSGDVVANQMVVTIYNPNDDRFELLGAAPALNLNGLTTETAIAADDHVAITDTSASNASEKITVTNFLKAINVLTEDTAPDTDADFLITYDASASTVKKVKPDNVSYLVPLGIRTISSDANISFTDSDDLDTANFSTFMFELDNVLPATDDTSLFVRTRQDGQGSFDNGASDYNWAISGVRTDGGGGSSADAADSEIEMSVLNLGAGVGVDNAGAGWSGQVWVRSTTATGVPTTVTFQGTYDFNSSGSAWAGGGTGKRIASHAIDGVQFLSSSGNLASGTIKIYGLRNPS